MPERFRPLPEVAPRTGETVSLEYSVVARALAGVSTDVARPLARALRAVVKEKEKEEGGQRRLSHGRRDTIGRLEGYGALTPLQIKQIISLARGNARAEHELQVLIERRAKEDQKLEAVAQMPEIASPEQRAQFFARLKAAFKAYTENCSPGDLRWAMTTRDALTQYTTKPKIDSSYIMDIMWFLEKNNPTILQDMQALKYNHDRERELKKRVSSLRTKVLRGKRNDKEMVLRAWEEFSSNYESSLAEVARDFLVHSHDYQTMDEKPLVLLEEFVKKYPDLFLSIGK